MNENENAPQINPTPSEPGVSSPTMGGPGEPERKYGPLIGIIIIITLLVVGGFYLWGAQIADRALDGELEESTEDPMTQMLKEQSSSDDVSAIENDLEATSADNLDAELNDIESELEGEFELQVQ